MYRAFGRLLVVANVCAAVLTLAMMALIGLDVAGRVLFRAPLYGVPELIRLGIVCIVWLQIAYTLNVRKHLRAETVLFALGPVPRRIIVALNAVLGVAMFAVIAYAAWVQFGKAWSAGTFEGEVPVRVQVWPVWLIISVGSFLTGVEYLCQLGQAVGVGSYVDEAETTPENMNIE